MSAYLNVSSGPHTRSRLSTGSVMGDVCLSLLPATAVGIWHFGVKALVVVLASIATAVLTELVFDLIAKRGPTYRDGSAVITGLLLALCLSPAVPVYIPILGSAFAILFVKCFFGGLGKNFMNPALAGRCFLLISFSSTMTNYQYTDAVSSATPLVPLLDGKSVNLAEMFLGNGSATGVIGCSVCALLIGGIYLLIIRAMKMKREGRQIGSLIADLKEPVESMELRLDITESDFRSRGNAVIQNYFNMLEEVIGDAGCICRLGGDKFLCVFTPAVKDDVIRILSGVAVAYDENIDRKVKVSAAAGVYVIPENAGVTKDNVMERIMIATNVAKKQDEGAIVFYDDQMKETWRISVRKRSAAGFTTAAWCLRMSLFRFWNRRQIFVIWIFICLMKHANPYGIIWTKATSGFAAP